MNIEQVIKFLSSVFFGYLFCINFLLFIAFVVYYDAIEMPNTIGYVTLGLAAIASLFYCFITKQSSSETITFAFAVWFALGIFAHTINFLIAFDYQGRLVIESKRPLASYREEWKVRLDNNRIIRLKVSDIPSGYGANINLRKGIFGVYFGNWPE